VQKIRGKKKGIWEHSKGVGVKEGATILENTEEGVNKTWGINTGLNTEGGNLSNGYRGNWGSMVGLESSRN